MKKMMSTTTSSLALFLISFLVVSAFTTSKADDDHIVKESSGQNLKTGGTYKLFIVAFDGSDDTEVSVAEITRPSPENELCWLAVIQSHEKGLPVIIKDLLLKSEFVSTEYPVSISFSDKPITNCTDSSEWVIVKNPLVDARKPPVMVGNDEPEEFGDDVVKGNFYIKLHNARRHEYKFRFCYHYNGHEQCLNVGILKYHNMKRLVITTDRDDDPVVFKFIKVTLESETSMVA